MRRATRILAMTLIMTLLAGCGAGVSADSTPAEVRLFAVNVGKGDALLLRVGDWTGLIDAGKAKAMGRVKYALEQLGVERLDAVFLTHTDDDHAGGLEWLAESDIAVDAWYASGLYTGVKEKKHPMVKAAAIRGQDVQWLRRGDALDLGGGAALRVLAPASLFTDKDDNNSLVMLLESAAGRILLTGDMELPEEAELLAQGDDLSCAVLKVPNHGDDDTTSDAFARAASAQIALISTDSQEKPGTPDAGVVSRLEAAGSRVLVTQDAGLGWMVALKDGAATAEAADIDAAPVTGVYITEVDAGDDTITLSNNTGGSLELDGFYLHSDRGDELFAFPAGTTVAPGDELTVGTNSTDGSFDVLWDDKKVVHQKKTDTITLYDPCGRAVDRLDNGK